MRRGTVRKSITKMLALLLTAIMLLSTPMAAHAAENEAAPAQTETTETPAPEKEAEPAPAKEETPVATEPVSTEQEAPKEEASVSAVTENKETEPEKTEPEKTEPVEEKKESEGESQANIPATTEDRSENTEVAVTGPTDVKVEEKKEEKAPAAEETAKADNKSDENAAAGSTDKKAEEKEVENKEEGSSETKKSDNAPNEARTEEQFKQATENTSVLVPDLDAEISRDMPMKAALLATTEESSNITELTYTNNEKMFKAYSAKLEEADGKKTLILALTGTGYQYLYKGTKEEAEKGAETDRIMYETDADGKYSFRIPVSGSGKIPVSSLSQKNKTWTGHELTLDIEAKTLVLDAEQEKPVEHFDNSTTIPDGEYTIDADHYTFEGGTGKAKLTAVKVIVKEGKATALFNASSAYMTHVYLGQTDTDTDSSKYYDPSSDKSGTDVYPIDNKTVTIPVRINEKIDISARSTAMSEPHWIHYTYTIKIEENQEPDTPTPTLTPTPTAKPTATPTSTPKPTATPKPTKDVEVVDDGTYDVETSTTGKMFRVVGAKLNVKNGIMSAIITLSGTGYTRMYAGMAEDAPNDKANWKNYLGKSSKTDEGYYFEVPVAELDVDLPFAAFSEKNQIWYQRWIKFSSEGLPTHIEKKESSEDEEKKPIPTPTATPTPTPTEAPPKNNGSTSSQDTSTTLADGTYTPDSFSFSGGTGKLQISCTKITVRGGKTYATLHFSSKNISYVKANGSTYYMSGQDVEIPVVLNKNMKIIALTTAMSQPHEVAYSIYIGLAAAGNAADTQTAIETTVGNQYDKLDETAPNIAGLAFAGETVTAKSDLVKIFRYTDEQKNTFTLVEIDMVKNTAKDPKWLEEHPEAADLTKAEASTENAAAGEEAPAEEAPAEEAEAAEAAENAAAEDAETKEADTAATLDEQKIALYEKDIVKYLIVPKDKEVPVGLDKLVVIIQQPADKSYAATAEEIKMLDELGLADQIAAVGVEKDEIEVDAVKEAIGKEEIVFGGAYNDLDSRELIKAEANFALQSSALLPKKESELEESKKALHKLANRAVMMKMPAVIMRNDDETEEAAAAEWYKVLGAVYGAEEKANAVCEEKIAAIEKESANS